MCHSNGNLISFLKQWFSNFNLHRGTSQKHNSLGSNPRSCDSLSLGRSPGNRVFDKLPCDSDAGGLELHTAKYCCRVLSKQKPSPSLQNSFGNFKTFKKVFLVPIPMGVRTQNDSP